MGSKAQPSLPRVRTYTFGCKVNLTDSVAMATSLERCGASISTDPEEKPDLVIVNTCTVTASADRQARQLLRRIHRENPEARIVVTGCGAEVHPEAYGRFGGVAAVVPISEQLQIAETLGLEGNPEGALAPIESFPGRTRAVLKMQDGCNAYCGFCILPYIRGRSRSISLNDLEQQASAFAVAGYREIVVTGTHLGAWGRDLQPRRRFSDALAAVINASSGVAFRVSSLEPTTLKPDVIRLVRREQRIRPHFHIPLQSGSDLVLRRMNRKYRVDTFAERVRALATTRDAVSIGSDVMVGFPGETEDDFQATLMALQRLPITYVHAFRYSPRPGTGAKRFLDDVSPAEKRRRVRAVCALGERKRRAFNSRFLDTVQEVLVEKKRDAHGRLVGYTPHYVPVRFNGPDRLMGLTVEIRLEDNEGIMLTGRAA